MRAFHINMTRGAGTKAAARPFDAGHAVEGGNLHHVLFLIGVDNVLAAILENECNGNHGGELIFPGLFDSWRDNGVRLRLCCFQADHRA